MCFYSVTICFIGGMEKMTTSQEAVNTKQPNIILIMADQFRFDAIGAHGNQWISTPTLDEMIYRGIDFVNAYSATPTCIPARASLLTGLSQSHTGLIGYREGTAFNYPKFLGEAFAEKGYYAKAVGKMHVSPPRRLCGFHHIDLHDGYLHATRNSELKVKESFERTDDYLAWLKEVMPHTVDLNDMGLDCNSWVARPFVYEERYHPTNWATQKAIEFLDKRDPTMPFFLKLSYVRPHSPLDPPKYYFDMYMDLLSDMPEEELDNWVNELGISSDIDGVASLTGVLNRHDKKRMLAGYYGLVTHIDHQINRFLIHLQEHNLLYNSIIVFTSDHGDQLGEHRLFRKGFAYQGSVHIPWIVFDPGENIAPKNLLKSQVDKIVELRDMMPSLVDFATNETLDNIDGVSIKPLLFKDETGETWREWLHGEHVLGHYSHHYILKTPWKLVWYAQDGTMQLFNIDEDPHELRNLIHEEGTTAIVEELTAYLIESLEQRQSVLVKDGQLVHGIIEPPYIKQKD